MKSFKLFKESIIDIPRRTFAPAVFDDEEVLFLQRDIVMTLI